jgi:biopolymer transport protein ExbD
MIVARRTVFRRHQSISEINLTPLIDLTFLLLITFVITFPLVQQGIPLKLPKGAAAELPANQKQTISIDRQGRIYLNDLLASFAEMETRMVALGRNQPDTVILVRADEGVSYGHVAQILRVLYKARLTRMALVTQADSR